MLRRSLLILVLVAACGGPSAPSASPAPSGHEIVGSLTLANTPVVRPGGACQGIGGFGDIRPGMRVVVKDDAGKVIGTGKTEVAPTPTNAGGFPDPKRCDFSFRIPVPDVPFYSVSIENRGELTYSRDELAGRGWKVEMNITGS